MVTNTVHKIGEKLERLSRRNFSLGAALDLLAGRARNVEDQIVIEVMREVYRDMHPDVEAAAQAFSNSRSA